MVMARYTTPSLLVLAVLASAAFCLTEARTLQQIQVRQLLNETCRAPVILRVRVCALYTNVPHVKRGLRHETLAAGHRGHDI